MEYMSGGSLQNLIERVGALPENILLKIAQKLWSIISFIHNKAKISNYSLTISQILFDKDGRIKLGRPSKSKKSNLFGTPSESTKADDSIHSKSFRSIFDLGYILLLSATGGFELMSDDFSELDSQTDASKIVRMFDKSEKSGNVKIPDLLDRYSPEFSDFLWKWFQFNPKDKDSFSDLIGKNGHPWLSSQNDIARRSSFSIGIKDLLKVSSSSSENNKLDGSNLDDFKQNQVEKLHIEWIETLPASISKAKIRMVADELGIDYEYLHDRLKEIGNYKYEK